MKAINGSIRRPFFCFVLLLPLCFPVICYNNSTVVKTQPRAVQKQ